MKASVKVREGQRPLVRAKVPVQVAGLPFYSGISVGDEKELALHLGTNMEAGPSCSISYRPNDLHSPIAVLLKTGFGLWGSPHAAPFTIAAQFNLARRENVSFTLRLKPRVGSFSFRKHFLSTSGTFGRDLWSSERQIDAGVQEEVEVERRPSGGPSQGDGLTVYETDYDCGLSPLGLSQVKVIEKKCYTSGDPGSPISNEGLQGSAELEIPSVLEGGVVHLVSQRSLGNGDRAAATDGGAVILGALEDQSKTVRRNRLLQSWSAGCAHPSWGLTVHSAVPLGRQAMGRVQWGMRMPSRAVDLEARGGSFYGHKLPVLVLDKISISSVDPRRKAQSSAFPPDTGPLSYGMRYFENPVGDGSQLGLIASVCCSMRNQLHSLHSDNRSLKKTIEDMKTEMMVQPGSWGSEPGKRLVSGSKAPTRPTPEEDAIRAQLFEELQKTTSSRAPPKDRPSFSSGVSSDRQKQPESIFDLPSEGLLGDRTKSSDSGAKARAK